MSNETENPMWANPAIATAETAIFLWQGFMDVVSPAGSYQVLTVEQQGEYDRHFDGIGQTGGAMSMAAIAVMIEQEFKDRWAEHSDNFDGVYHYDITESLGAWLATDTYLIKVQYSDAGAMEDIRQRYNELMSEWLVTPALTAIHA